MNVIANTFVADRGWTVYSFDVGHAPGKISASDFSIQTDAGQTFRVKAVTATPSGIRLELDPFAYGGNWRVTGSGAAADIQFNRDDVSKVNTDWADKFEARQENGVLYRLYSPECSGPRPLVLFLHGGGECGKDNWVHMVATLGAARIAQDYPDVFVMAPQAPEGGLVFVNGQPPVMPSNFVDAGKLPGGWTRDYLAKTCDVIRKMIADGKVNPARVYVTGLSMGGAGTLRALSVGNDIFAAAAPICPSMMPETYGILCSLTDTKLWVSISYVDHTIYRHKYIVDAILQLRDAGNKNAKLTIYSPEELERYGFGVDPDMPLKQKFSENHNCWVLTYHNEHGIMDWLMSQTKD